MPLETPNPLPEPASMPSCPWLPRSPHCGHCSRSCCSVSSRRPCRCRRVGCATFSRKARAAATAQHVRSWEGRGHQTHVIFLPSFPSGRGGRPLGSRRSGRQRVRRKCSGNGLHALHGLHGGPSHSLPFACDLPGTVRRSGAGFAGDVEDR